jgi:hypothetical protein
MSARASLLTWSSAPPAAPSWTRCRTVLRGADRARRPVLNLLPRRPRRFVAARGALLRAAVLVLVVAGAASAAVPGSPVRRLLVNLWQQTTKLFVSHPAAPVAPVAQPPAPTPAPPLAFPVGVSVRPLDGRIQVLLDTPAPGLRVHVRLVDGELASVQASGPASSARFSTGPGRIEVVGGGPGDLLIDLPRTTDAAQVRADDQLLFSKIGARVRHAPVVDSTDEGMLFRLLP